MVIGSVRALRAISNSWRRRRSGGKAALSLFRFAPSPNGFFIWAMPFRRCSIRNWRRPQQLGCSCASRTSTPGGRGGLVRNRDDRRSELARLALGRAAAPTVGTSGGLCRRPLKGWSRGLAYPCFCSRSDIARACAAKPDWPRDPDGALLYPGICRALVAVRSGGAHDGGRAFFPAPRHGEGGSRRFRSL